MNKAEEHLISHGIKPSAVRLLVWKSIRERSETFSLGDIERDLMPMDKSSIFRALRLFAAHQMLHEVDDGTGQKKYCVCRCSGSHHTNHIHFSCTCCGTTYCLEDLSIPPVSLPEGFTIDDTEYVIKGVCPKCNSGA